ncbi:hypothetical protein J6590_080736 [Homalodisca vitripennis]|nr:hypothetical protein J6590_080736 [Homalodisca vitripennis]
MSSDRPGNSCLEDKPTNSPKQHYEKLVALLEVTRMSSDRPGTGSCLGELLRVRINPINSPATEHSERNLVALLEVTKNLIRQTRNSSAGSDKECHQTDQEQVHLGGDNPLKICANTVERNRSLARRSKNADDHVPTINPHKQHERKLQLLMTRTPISREQAVAESAKLLREPSSAGSDKTSSDRPGTVAACENLVEAHEVTKNVRQTRTGSCLDSAGSDKECHQTDQEQVAA